MAGDTKISIILPAYNEEANIESAVKDIFNYMDGKGWDFEVIVVDDGSKDLTSEIVNRLRIEYKELNLIAHERNLGYGKSIMDGFNAAKNDLLFFTDSDRQFKIESIGDMIELTGEADIVVGYRINRQDPLIRLLLSWGFNIIVRFLFDINVRDIDCAFKIFHKRIFDKVKVETTQFFFNTEVLAKAKYFGYSIKEVGVPHFPRQAGSSSVSPKYIPITVHELQRIRKSIKNLTK
ncbi:MAG: glycosyltransferase family 2 protein [Nitrospirota bacterium]